MRPRTQRPRTAALVAGALLLAALLATPVAADIEEVATLAGPVQPLRIRPLPAEIKAIGLASDGQGGHLFVVERTDGSVKHLRPDELAELLQPTPARGTWLYRFLNITSPIGLAWVALGLLGQVLFTGRMLVQWLASERHRRSVVPVAFWWMSLVGATMLMLYFVWRRDVVGVLGQSAGWLIYLRNLWLIYRGPVAGSEELAA